MKRVAYIVFFISCLSVAQVQVGNDIYGVADNDRIGRIAYNNAGDIVAIGSIYNDDNGSNSGEVRVFQYNGTDWVQMGQDLNGIRPEDNYGHSIALNAAGDILVVGAPYWDWYDPSLGYTISATGMAQVFYFNGTNWEQIGDDIFSTQITTVLGYSVAINDEGNIIALGAPWYTYNGVDNQGAVMLFEYDGTNWVQKGNTIIGEAPEDAFGGSGLELDATGNRVFIGAYKNDSITNQAGEIEVYGFDGTNWSQLGTDITGQNENGFFGSTLDVTDDGNTIVSRTYLWNSVNEVYLGANVQLFTYDGTNWIQTENNLDEEAAMVNFVTINGNGDTVAVSYLGSDANDPDPTANYGEFKVYKKNNGNWLPLTLPYYGTQWREVLGYGIQLNNSGLKVVVSSLLYDSQNFTNNGRVQIFDLTDYPPQAVCQNITVQLDQNGQVTVDPQSLDGGSTDNFFIANYSLDINSFDCLNIGNNSVTLTVTDSGGNTDSCTAVITVEDNTPPQLECTDIIVELDQNGTASILPQDVILSLTDACGVETTAIDVTQFDCNDAGTTVDVQVFAMDVNQNASMCTANISVVDALPPVITCPDNQTVSADQSGIYTLPDYWSIQEVTATDNCTQDLTQYSQSPVAGTSLPVGVYTIVFSVEDNWGNIATCEFELTVEAYLGMESSTAEIEIQLYPNPAGNEVLFSCPSQIEIQEINIIDLNGRLVYADKNSLGKITRINLSTLKTGVYFVQIKTSKTIIIKRLIKK